MLTVFIIMLFYVTLFLLPIWTVSQDCSTPGQWCVDDNSCCGGCCIEGKCLSVSQSCSGEKENPCMVHLCPGGFECYLYQPPDCDCAPYPDCRPHI